MHTASLSSHNEREGDCLHSSIVVATMMAMGDKSSGVKHFKFKGVRDKGLVCEVKNARAKLYYTAPQGSSPQEAAVFVDLFLLLNVPDVDERDLNLNMVVRFLGSSLNIDKTFYQEFIEKNPLDSLTKEELWVKAIEVYNLLVQKVSGVEGRRREDQAGLPPAFEEGVKYQDNLTFESLQQVITSLEEASKKKDAECKEKDAEIGRLKESVSNQAAECKEKDAEIGRLKGELYAANAKVDGQPLKRRASSVTATGELQGGNASTSKDAMPALEDDIEALFADTDALMDWFPIAPLPGEFNPEKVFSYASP